MDRVLSNRQVLLLSDYLAAQGEFVPSAELAEKRAISTRTLRTDNKAIREYISNYGATLESVASKGTRLIVDNRSKFDKKMRDLLGGNTRHTAFNERSSRVLHILFRLSRTKGYLDTKRLATEMFVSRSTFTEDLRAAREVIERYDHLRIETKQGSGIRLVGDEQAIRECIIKQNITQQVDSTIALAQGTEFVSYEYLSLGRIVTECLIEHHFTVSDFMFQTILVHLGVSLDRMRCNHYIENTQELASTYHHAYEIASEILQQCCKLYKLRFSVDEARILAINLQGKRELESDEYVTKEVNDFIYKTLVAIRDEYGFDLTTDMSLRISLALHVVPLLERAAYNMQLDNSIMYEVKQQYVLAFDLASKFAQELQKTFGARLTEGEVSYIAMHFSVALGSRTDTQDQKSILLISPERKSNTVLIQQKLMQWFPNTISCIDIIGAKQIDTTNIDAYDAVFTTDKSLTSRTGAIPIDFFLSDKDYNKIKLAISGFSRPEDLIEVFDRKMFHVGHIESKEEAFRIVAANAEQVHPQNTGLFEAISNHEQFTNSYFGHLVAMPHPNTPVTSSTFVSVAVSDAAIDWGGGQGSGCHDGLSREGQPGRLCPVALPLVAYYKPQACR